MWFKNLTVFRLVTPFTATPAALEAELVKRQLPPCTGLETKSRGWVPAHGNGQYVYNLDRHLLIALGVEERLLPGSVVADEVQARVEAYEARTGRPPGRKQRQQLKEEATAALLPRAFIRRKRLLAWIDPVMGLLCIDTASLNKAEELAVLLIETLGGELRIERLPTARSAPAAMTEWLAAGTPPGALVMGDDTELSRSDEPKATVRYLRHDLSAPEVRQQLAQHLADGKLARRLGLTWDNRVTFVLDAEGALRRLAFPDVEDDRDAARDNRDEQFDVDMAISTGTLAPLVQAVWDAVGRAPEGGAGEAVVGK